jgi:hypothetical protein
LTTSRQFADSEGEFSGWKDHPEPCSRPLLLERPNEGEPLQVRPVCGGKVKYREWESSDGAYTDYQYFCENGHRWWVDGIDS